MHRRTLHISCAANLHLSGFQKYFIHICQLRVTRPTDLTKTWKGAKMVSDIHTPQSERQEKGNLLVKAQWASESTQCVRFLSKPLASHAVLLLRGCHRSIRQQAKRLLKHVGIRTHTRAHTHTFDQPHVKLKIKWSRLWSQFYSHVLVLLEVSDSEDTRCNSFRLSSARPVWSLPVLLSWQSGCANEYFTFISSFPLGMWRAAEHTDVP